MKNKVDRLVGDLKEELGFLLSICFGIFLFILFFQPFAFTEFDFNNTLLFVGGMAVILFIIMVLVRIIVPGFFQRDAEEESIIVFAPYFQGFVILVLSSVSVVFYLRYVGHVNITFFVTIRIVLICLLTVIIIAVHDFVIELKGKNILLMSEKKNVQREIEKYEDELLNRSIEFISENSAENFSLLISEVVLIKSAENYVEIIYKEGDSFRKKLIRNTLRNIELQIKQYTNFIRCHRICIVNMHFAEKLIKNAGNYWLTIKGYDQQVPVSRQYLLKLKEAL